MPKLSDIYFSIRKARLKFLGKEGNYTLDATSELQELIEKGKDLTWENIEECVQNPSFRSKSIPSYYLCYLKSGEICSLRGNLKIRINIENGIFEKLKNFFSFK